MKSTFSLVVCLLIASESFARPVETPELHPLPDPALEKVDPAVGQSLREARDKIREIVAGQAASPEELAAAYGSLGKLYLLYGLEAEAEACLHNAGSLDPRDYRWPYYQAVIFQGDGRLTAAREALVEYLSLRPGDPTASLRAGQVELELADLEAAKAQFRQAATSPGTAAAARYGMGQIALLEGQFEAAARYYEEVLADQPEASTAHYQLGLAYRELGDVEKAREHLAQHGQQAVSFIDPLMSTLRSGSTGAALHVVDGALARSRGDYPTAIAAFRRALAENPDDLPVRLSLAASLAQIGATDEALEIFGDVLQTDPTNASAHYNVGTILARRRQLTEALGHLQQAVEGAPDFASAHVSLAAVLAQLGRFEEADNHYVQALLLDPANTQARTQRTAVLMSMGRIDVAESELRQVLTREPTNTSAWLGLAQILETTNRPGEAYEALSQVLELGADPAQIHPQLARLLAEAGRYGEAAEHFAAVVQRSPRDEDARFGMALALLYAERYSEVKNHLEESLQVLPESSSLKHLLARLLATCPDEGVRDGERALSLIQETMELERRPEYAETLAMAWAELGSFDQAIEVQQWIIEQAERSGRQDLLPALRRRLSLYKQGNPCRSPWLDSAGAGP